MAGLATYKGGGGGWWLLLAGGVSNVIDRLVGKGVVDIFFLFGWWFNLADVVITIGVWWLILVQWSTPRSGGADVTRAARV